MKRPKLFYMPGMISLLVLPVLLYRFQPIKKKQTVLKLVVPWEGHPEDRDSPFMQFSRSGVMATIKGKKINTVYYDENHELNARKLEFIAQEALKLKFYHDTSQVIKVHLSADNIYNEFVQLENIMVRDGHKRYAWIDDDFYVFGEEPPKPETIAIPLIECSTADMMIIEKDQREGIGNEIKKYKTIIINNALLLSAFVLLIIVPAIIKRKRGY